MHPLAIYFLLFPLTAQADLYKCTDSAGKVTYTNSACAKAGLKEAKVIPPPPPPVLDKPAKAPEAAKPAVEKSASSTKVKDIVATKETVALQLVKSTSASADKCAKLNGDVGRIMDEMDATRRNGQADSGQSAWNESLKKLQTEKNRLGCF
jgi:hypothetical protein